MARLKAILLALVAGGVFILSPVLIPIALWIGAVVIVYKLVRHDQDQSKDHQE